MRGYFVFAAPAVGTEISVDDELPIFSISGYLVPKIS
jgi:hypothetical protein